MGGRFLIKAVISANSGKSEDFFSRMDCILDTTCVNLLTAGVMDTNGSVGLKLDFVVREDTLIWRVLIFSWSYFCFDS